MNRLVGVIALLWTTCAAATPGKDVIDTCLRAADTYQHVKYESWPYDEINEIHDDGIGRNELAMRYRGQAVGKWTSKPRQTWGISLNGKDTAQANIIRIDKKNQPYEFDPSKAMLGAIRAGARKYVCVTFNFDGIGRSGSHQDVGGAYLISAKPRQRVYYAVGNIAVSEK